jgi:hypothetical protein
MKYSGSGNINFNSPSNCTISGHYTVPDILATEHYISVLKIGERSVSSYLDQAFDLLLDMEGVWLEATC